MAIHRDDVEVESKRLIPHIGPTMHYANLPFSFSRDHSAILEAAQTYCRYIGVLALGVLRVLRIYVAEGKN